MIASWLLLVLCLLLAMERVATGFSVEEESYPSQINKDLLKVAKQIFAQVAEQTKRLYSVNEIVFCDFIRDFSNSFDRDFFEENFDTTLAYQVKRLIELISQHTEVDF